jgi:hypothetical protein
VAGEEVVATVGHWHRSVVARAPILLWRIAAGGSGFGSSRGVPCTPATSGPRRHHDPGLPVSTPRRFMDGPVMRSGRSRWRQRSEAREKKPRNIFGPFACSPFMVTVLVPATILFTTDASIMRAEPNEQLGDALHCIGYFNFINRVFDGLGVDP